MLRRLLCAGVVVALLLVSTLSSASAEDGSGDAGEVTLVVGLTQPWETLNPVIGYAVPEYEVWNIQYTGLTSRAAADFSPTPGLAESWEENDPGISYTYTLRDGLQWSDGTPITAEDIAWNINTSRDQEWANYVATVANLTAEVVDDQTVTITSSVPDPKLPAVEIYFLPKHIWEAQATPDTIETYDGLDGVGSGPFVISDYEPEASLTMVANDNYYDGRRPIDKVIFRYFSNPDAMVAALQRGEIDAAHGVPAGSMEDLDADPDIVTVSGIQGGFDEIALNLGAAEGQPNPAILDIEFRRALNHAIDKAGATEDLWFGLAEPATTISVGADLKWVPDIPADEQLDYDPELAKQILDDAGYIDTDGDGFREMPGGGDNIVLRHAVNTDSDLGGAVGELFSGWMNAIGIDVSLDSYDQDQLFGVIVDGTYDSFYWGWVPYVDPNLMLSYFTAAELGNFNDANWTNADYDALYDEQLTEVDPDRRLEIVHEMVRMIYDDAGYAAVWYSPDLQAYRTDRFEGYVQQPADIGPVIFSQSSPSYALITPVGGGGGGGGSNTGLLVGAGAAALAVAGLAGWFAMKGRRTADERE